MNRSLAILEYLAHIDPLYIPEDLVIATLEVPDELAILPAPALPAGWKDYPAPESLRGSATSSFATVMQRSCCFPPC